MDSLLLNLQRVSPLLTFLRGHTDNVTSLAFSPDGKTLVSGKGNGTILLWDVSDPTMPRSLGQPLTGHTDYVNNLAFSRDGKTLASGSGDGIILWDVSDPQHPHSLGPPLTGHPDLVTSLAFSPDSNILTSRSWDGTIILWDVNPESWQRQACRIVNRNMTQAEWQQFMGDLPYGRTCPDLPPGEGVAEAAGNH